MKSYLNLFAPQIAVALLLAFFAVMGQPEAAPLTMGAITFDPSNFAFIGMASLSAGALTKLGNYSLDTHIKAKTIDQIGQDRPFLKWIMEHKKQEPGGLQFITEPVMMQYQSNFGAYSEDDIVPYNDRNPTRRTQWEWAEYHDGCTINESELRSNGFVVDDADGNETIRDASGADKVRLSNLLNDTMSALSEGYDDSFDLMLHRDGSQSAKDVPGLDGIVRLDPLVGTIGGFDAATTGYWRNHAQTGLDVTTIGAALHTAWRTLRRHRAKTDLIIAGSAFIDAARESIVGGTQHYVQREQDKIKGLELSNEALYFQGVPIQYDPTFDDLDDLLGPTVPWSNRAYLLDSRHLKYVEVDKRKRRHPKRPHDVYAYFWAITQAGALTCNKMRAQAVLAIA